jgi:hypothetical protein
MKKIIFVLLAICIGFTVNAQPKEKKVELSSLSLSSGKSPLSAGLFFEANFNLGNDVINVSLGERDLYAIYLKGIGSKFHIGPSFEYFYNVPVLGAMAIWEPWKFFSTFTWTGISAGTPDMKVELLNWRFLFFYQSLDFHVWRFTASAVMMYYDGWRKIVDFKYVQPISEKFSIFTSAGYDFYKEGSALLKIGIMYKR